MRCFPVGFGTSVYSRGLMSEHHQTPFSVILEMIPFSTFPTTTTPFTSSLLNVLSPALSSVHPQSHLISSIPFIHRLLIQFQTLSFFPHIASSSFQDTQQHPLLSSKSKLWPPSFSVLPSMFCIWKIHFYLF